MPELLIEIVKRPDGGALLRCTRRDDSVSWQRQSGPQATFFPLHDLTHYSVETVLGIGDGFFGLVAQGWEIDETTGKGARGPLPADAVVVEHIVGFLDVERATGGVWSAEDYCDQLAIAGVALPPRVQRALTDAALARIRELRLELFARWSMTAAGDALRLSFSVPAGDAPR